MADIYRKSAIEKLSSPEQLDRAIVIISPSFWLAIAGAALIVIVALIWSIFGKLPQNVSSNGIFMNRDGIYTVYSEAGGTVEEINTDTGERVQKGEVIARLSSRTAERKIAALEGRKEDVEAVTLTSTSDKATDDNKALLDLKSQALTADSSLISDQYMLEARQGELETQKGKTAAARTALEELEIKYYLTLLPVDTNKANITFEELQTNLNSAKSNLESVKSTLLGLRAQNENTEERYDKAKKRYKDADESDEDYNDLKSEYEEAKKAWKDYQAASDEYELSIKSWESVISQTGAQYEDAKAGLINSQVLHESSQAYNSQVNAAYDRALSNYNTEASAQRNLEEEILQLEAKMAGEESELRKQNSALASQFDAAKAAAIFQLDREIKENEEQIENNLIRSATEGTVTELSVVEGQVIAAGDYVARLSQGDDSDNVVVCYIPVAEGRKVEVGMNASIYPSTANKQEYGHMKGTVEYVDQYVTSRAEITNQVGVVSLVDSFLQNGPVIEVRLSLERDENTESGYWWSSKRGADIRLVKGTIVSADIAVEEKAPISMLIPYLKEKFTVKRAPAENSPAENTQ